MSVLDRLSIRQKLVWGYGLSLGISVFGIAMGLAIGTYQFEQAKAKADIIGDQTDLLSDIQGQLMAIHIYEQELANQRGGKSNLVHSTTVIIDHSKQLSKLITELEASIQKYPVAIKSVDSLLITNAGALKQYTEKLNQTTIQIEPLITQPGGDQKIALLIHEFQTSPEASTIDDFSDQIIDLTQEFRELQAKAEQAELHAKNLALQIIVGSLLLSITFTIILALFLCRAISRPIISVTQFAERM